VSGAGFVLRARSVVLPLVAPVAGAGALLVFLTAFNELTVSALLWSGGAETVGVVVFNLGDSGLQPLAAAVSVASVGVMLAAMAALQAMAGRLPAGALPWSEPR
jgi:iron(III) transport system permease protein